MKKYIFVLLFLCSCSTEMEEMQINSKLKEIQSLKVGDQWNEYESKIECDNSHYIKIFRSYSNKNVTNYCVQFKEHYSWYTNYVFIIKTSNMQIQEIKLEHQ